MEQPAGPRFDARDYLRIIHKRIWFVFAISVAAALLGGVIAYMGGKPQYRAYASVLVKQPVEGLLWVGATPPESRRQTISLETQARIAQGTRCAELTWKRLKSATNLGIRVPSVSEILKAISVTVIRPDVLRIEARADNKLLAIALANETANSFKELSGERQRNEVKSAREYLEEQLKATEQQLAEAARKTSEYQRKTGLLVPEAAITYIQSALNDFQTEKARAETELRQAEAVVAKLERLIANTPPATVAKVPVPNPVRQALLESLQNDQLALTRLRAQYTDQYPGIQTILARIEETKARIQELPPVVEQPQVQPNGFLESAKTQLENERLKVSQLRAQIASYERAIEQLHRRAENLVDKESEFARRQDEMELARERHKKVVQELSVKKLEEATTTSADVDVFDRALDAEEVGPNVPKTIIYGFFLGIFAGIGLALVLEALDDTIRTPEDIARYTTAPFLGIVPRTDDATAEPVTITGPKSPPAEAYRTLRSNITFALVDSPARTFVITSAGASEGKSSVLANLAVAFAQAGHSVIVVDSDLRRPILHRLFGRDASRGLSNLLVGEMSIEEVLQDTAIANLKLIASGPLPPNPAELLGSVPMDGIIDRLAQMADIVLFDSPPTIMLTDALILSSKVDRVILVAEAGQVTRDAFNEVVRLIRHARGNILGCVLNKLRLTASDYYYYYYYYYYDYSSREEKEAPRRVDVEHAAAPQPAEEEGEERIELPWERPEWLPEEEQESGAEAERQAPPSEAGQPREGQDWVSQVREPDVITEPEEAEPKPEPPQGEQPPSEEEPPPLPWDRPPPRDQQ